MNIFLQRVLALLIFIASLPLFGLIWLAIKLDDDGSFFFKQKRMGKGKKSFVMFKFRTMVKGAGKLKVRYKHLNEAGGPTFKIYNDPRYTHVGRFLAHTGLDELPQLINVIKGEMVLVGPRPLPWDEAIEVPKKYHKRFSVLPGITSPWVVQGSHNLSFKEWMKLDLEYAKKKTFWFDIQTLFLTAWLIIKWSVQQLLRKG